MLRNRAYAELIDHEELFAPVFGEYAVPAALREYDSSPSGSEISRIGEEVFLRWLHYTLKGQTVPVRKSPVPLECEKAEEAVEYAPGHVVEATFHPEYPEAEDFLLGEADEDYKREAHVAKIQTLIAQQKCAVCPIAKTCLDVSIIHSPADGVWGVFGGMNEASRKLIANRFHKLRRAYNSKKTDEMDDETKRRYEGRAVSKQFD